MFTYPHQTLYRGMILNDDELRVLKSNSGQYLQLTNYSSWTTDVKIAKSFVSDKSKSISKKRGHKVIFSINPMKVKSILDVHAYISYLYGMGIINDDNFDELNLEMALDEYEVIMDKNIKLNWSNIFKILN